MARIFKLLNDMTATTTSINDDLKSILATVDNLVVTWGREKVPREPFRHHEESKSHVKHVLIVKENSVVEVPKFQRNDIGKEEAEETIKIEEVVNRANKIAKVEQIDFIGIDNILCVCCFQRSR